MSAMRPADHLRRIWAWSPAIAVGAAAALLLAGVVLALNNERAYRAQKINEITVQAQIVASTVTAALVFNDREAAQEYVNALSANPEIEAAAVFGPAGRRYAAYARKAGEGLLPDETPSLGASFGDGRLVVATPVMQRGTQIGTVYVESVTEPLARRIERYSVVGLLVVMGSLVMLVLAAAHWVMTRANDELTQANRNLQTQIAERQKAEEALGRAQRIEAVGQLTAGVAHDFNNLLTAVLGNLDMLAMRHADDPRSVRMIASAQRAGQRGANLTAQLLAFARQQRLEPLPVDLNRLVESMEPMLRATLGGAIDIVSALSPGIPNALADASQVELMIVNLAINARDSLPNGGAIGIETAFARFGAPSRPEEPPAGEYVVVSVRDNGTGIAPEIVDRVFEPFFTTKEVGKGSGLGLSQVVGVAQQLGGGVRLETRPGHGTTVRVCLPVAPDDQAATAAETAVVRPAAPSPAGRAALLLVDDDADVRAVTAAMLREVGHAVFEASDGAGALEVVRRYGEKIDLLISDFAMPGMNGVELARAVRATLPHLPVLFITGFAETAALSGYALSEEMLRKPFLAQNLVEKVEMLLTRDETAAAPKS
jgi:signal transduction histidine kinase/ActR/RegA family two-component response regulator